MTATMTSLRVKALDLKSLMRAADWLAVGVVVAMPWSTSVTIILIALWIVAVLPTLDVAAVRRELMSFAGGLPVLLWLVAATGMLWADVSWHDRIDGLGGFHRLLVIPLLLAHFRRSEFGPLACYGFLVSAAGVLTLSWLFVISPAWVARLLPRMADHIIASGVPVKDYIWQSGSFLICALGLVGAAWERWHARQRIVAVLLIGLAAVFVADIVFVITSRTVMLVAPVLIAALGYRLLGWRGLVGAGLIAAVLGAAAWAGSPYLRDRVDSSFKDLRAYKQSDAANSTGLHLDFLRESLGIIRSAPLIGHGTGSIHEQFSRVATGQSGTASAVATVNPHNQIFAVAIELGMLGTAVLAAMWAAHILLFGGGGLIGLIGMLIVLENVVSSLVNSHLFDFTQGWFYVFGVGICGGTVLRHAAPASPVRRRDANGPVSTE